MASTVILKAAGLKTSPNQLDLTDGAMSAASNIVIKRDGVIQPRRGVKLFGNELPHQDNRVLQLAVYRNRLLRHYDTGTLQFDSTGRGTFEDYLTNVIETETGSRLKFIESNGNLYFTTSEGIKKLSAKNAGELDDIQPGMAGAVKALDLDGKIVYEANSQTGFLPQDSVVAYRVVWNKKDNNNNLITGTPSQRAVVYNPMAPFVSRDFVRVLRALDSLNHSLATAASIDDGNYVETLLLGVNASASEIRTNLIALAAKLDNDIFYADQGLVAPIQIASAAITSGICTITCSGASVTDYIISGSKIRLTNFSAATGTLETEITVTSSTATTIVFNTAASGAVTVSSGRIHSNLFRAIPEPDEPNIPATNQDLVDIQDYLDIIILSLQGLSTEIIENGTDADTISALDLTTTATVDLTFTIPEEVTLDDEYFYQIYRSSIFQAVGSTVLDDGSPNDELQLVYEDYPTEDELAALEINISDITPEDFRGANLYTNASTGEGITNANDQPPFAKDVNRYRNSLFFANTRTKQRLNLNLLGVSNMISDYDDGTIPKLTLTNGETTNTYEFVTGKQEISVVTCKADSSDSLNGTYFILPAATGKTYLPYFETSGGDGATAPSILTHIPVKVSIDTDATANEVAEALTSVMSTYTADFIVDNIFGAEVEFINVEVGELYDFADGDTGFTFDVTQQGRGEKIEAALTTMSVIDGSLYKTSGTADYITFNTAFNQNRMLYWFNTGSVTEPSVGGRTNVEIEVDGTETDDEMAVKIQEAMDGDLFRVVVIGSYMEVHNIQYGPCDDATEVVDHVTFDLNVIREGALQVLLSPLVSPARAVDATAKSLVKVINKNLGDMVYAFYLSGALDVPGKILLEGRNLQNTAPFYVVANNDNTGASFNPVVSPETTISTIGTGDGTVVITTASAHGMTTGDEVVITSTNSQPIVDGLYEITYISSTSFSIPSFVAVAGTSGSISRASVTLVSENEEKSNRVYYSKYLQPEAVPIINYFDIGSEDKKILRIMPLRDSLFVFKEDGLYRISGDVAPFQLELFDNSFILLAPDSVVVCNNVIYAWTTQGIQALSEGGAFVISRDIDNIILKLQSANYVNFKTATWGLGYESDNAYIVYTVAEIDDEVAQIAYRYDTVTQVWTTYDLAHSCGVINNFDDKMYLGSTDVAYIEQERKSFDRTDYADREVESVIGADSLIADKLILPVVTDLKVGDTIAQEQTLSVYNFNLLLEKLDEDTGIVDADFYETLEMVQGDTPRNKLLALATKLDASSLSETYLTDIADKNGTITAIVSEGGNTVITSASHGLLDGRIIRIINSDSTPTINDEFAVTVLDANRFTVDFPIRVSGTTGTWSTVSEDFEDVRICFNDIIEKLNEDTVVNFSDYDTIDETTLFETRIIAINRITRQVTLGLTLDFVAGDITIYRAIVSTFTYSPNTMGDPLMQKHLSEATVMFETRALSGAELSFATDLLPEFIPVTFSLDGNGIFGHTAFGEGFFGGESNSAPFRTYVPRQCMRCRYIVVKFTHTVAREDYKILGITLSGNTGISIRTYR